MGGTLQLGKAQYGVGFAAAAGLDGDWLDYIFGGVWCVWRGLRGNMYVKSVRRKSIRRWNSMWGGEIDEIEIEGRKSEKS